MNLTDLFQRALPLLMNCVVFYQTYVNDVFFNTTCKEKTTLETVADALLIPYHYAFMGKIAVFREDGSWYFESRFDYSKHFWFKNIPAWLTAPASFAAGGCLKGISYALHPEMRERYRKLKMQQPVRLLTQEYREMGLFRDNPISDEPFQSQKLPRRLGDEKHLYEETEALKELGAALTEAGILWWVDCGTCLGTYRYGGTIPWDLDVDIAILEPDFQNAMSVLSRTHPDRYVVADWSSREHPFTSIKIFLRSNLTKEIDVYCFRIDPKEKILSFILAQENNIFLPQSWKIREKIFKTPVKFADVFPLKRAVFDGVPVFVPNQIEPYLQRVYGQNLAPAKIYNQATNSYEKDLSHPYWQRPYAH